jgi:hypothetical protein
MVWQLIYAALDTLDSCACEVFKLVFLNCLKKEANKLGHNLRFGVVHKNQLSPIS